MDGPLKFSPASAACARWQAVAGQCPSGAASKTCPSLGDLPMVSRLPSLPSCSQRAETCASRTGGYDASFRGWERGGFVPRVGCGAEFLRCRLRSLVGSPVLSRPGGVAGLSVAASLGPAQPATGEQGADFHGVTWWCFKSNFESSVLCVGIVSSLIPLYITCVYSYFPFLVVADK